MLRGLPATVMTTAEAQARAASVERNRSFVRLICPFLYDPETTRARINAADTASWSGTRATHRTWTRLDHRALLPDATRYLSVAADPSNAQSHARRPVHAAVWKLDNRFLTSAQGLGRGRLHHMPLGRRSSWVNLAAVELALFASGVGFIILEFTLAKPPQGMPEHDYASAGDPETWLDFAKYVRRISQPTMTRPFADAQDARRVQDDVAALLDTIGLHVVDDLEATSATNGALLSAFPITFTSLFISSASERAAREWVVNLRYGLGSNPGVPPSPEQLALDDPGIQRRSDRSWFFGSAMSTGFVGLDLPRKGFWQHFPGELRRPYQLALLMVLQQRHALLRVSELVSDYWMQPVGAERGERFAELQRRLHYLAAHLMPLQFSPRNSQQRFYRTMRHAFTVAPLHEDARRTVSELSESLRLSLSEEQTQQQERFERVVSAFALFFGVPSLVLAFLAVDVSGIHKPLPLLAALAALFASFALGSAIGLLARRRRR